MGLFETYRIAGGEAGMAHFLSQFGPALKWPWTKLTDVPELTEELVEKIASQSDAQSGAMTIRALERLRDNNLVAMMRALKQQGSAAGQLIKAHEKTISLPAKAARASRTISRIIPIDWTDYNGHMNESRYGQVFSDAADSFLASIGMNETYVAGGYSYFTAETAIKYMQETHAGDAVIVETEVMMADGKKLKLAHQMKRADDNRLLASCEQFLLHVSLVTRKSCAPLSPVAEALALL
jgi:carnitine 3-dehydrogenase